MESLEIRDIATDLERAARYYLEDAIKDRLGGKLREFFDAALKRRGMDTVVEISEPAAVFVDENPDGGGTVVTTIGDTKYTVTRVVTPRCLADVDDIRVSAGRFLTEVQGAVDAYVQTLDRGVKVATVPALYVYVQVYMVEWLLWGYAGRPNVQDHRPLPESAVTTQK